MKQLKFAGVTFSIALAMASVLAACGGGGAGGGTVTPPLSLFAGNADGIGNVDGTGDAARFNLPYSSATDADGNVYVADSVNHTIRKITPTGVVTTLAGRAGSRGHADGTGTTATFDNPRGIATDASGNVYVADAVNATIRKITPAGVVSTLAGAAGNVGHADGTGTAATFYAPSGIATDASGNVYVADTFNHTIRKITPAGVVTTLAGTAGTIGNANGTGAAASFKTPYGVATDASGNVYVADTYNYTIRKITPAGVVSTLAGSTAGGHADGTGTAASFNAPYGVATDTSGNVYVADTNNHTIRKITAAGVVTTLAGTAGTTGHADGTGTDASFSYLNGLSTDVGGNIYAVDTGNHTIRKITHAGEVTTLAGKAAIIGHADGNGTTATFQIPTHVAADADGNIYVVDSGNNAIRKITPAGVVITFAGSAPTSGHADGTGTAATFKNPSSTAIDAGGNVYVVDTGNNTIRKITAAGVVSTLAGTAGTSGNADGPCATATFNNVRGIAVDASGNLYVTDASSHTIRKITPACEVSTLAGTLGVSGHADGTGAAASFNGPSDIAIDGSGNLYVADLSNYSIRKITPAGVVSTLAGMFNQNSHADGTGTAALFSRPIAVDTDASGNVYVADYDNHAIRKITPAGVVTTPVGTPGVAKFVAGNLPGTIAYPRGVAVSGNKLYITTNNGVVVVAN